MSALKTITLTNRNRLQLEVSPLGATIMNLEVPNKNNELTNVVVGLDHIDDYQKKPYLETGLYLGTTVGRYAGRISKGQFTIDCKDYPIHTVDGIHLHGGQEGFDKKIWAVESQTEGATPSVTLSYFSKHLEEGYPGNLNVFVTYTLTEDNALKITYKATTDQTTIVNLTNHSYFNLNGKASILDHDLQLNSDFYLDFDAQLIPSGQLNPVKGTRFDYTKKTRIGSPNFIGLDDAFVLNDNTCKAEIESPTSGIKMKIFSNQPAFVIYTPLEFKKLPFKEDASFSEFPAICFEAQHFPDAPNNEHFPSTILKTNQTYLNETVFKFSTI